MSTVKVQGNASGTGSITLASPNTNSNRTINLPDVDGSFVTADASGNVGVGVTPSAWVGSYKALELGSGALVYAGNATNLQVAMNGYVNSGGSWTYKATGASSLYAQNSGQHQWFTAPSGTAGNAITFTQAMTLDASGNLGVGTTSPAARLAVNGASRIGANVVGQYLEFSHDTANGLISTSTGALGYSTPSFHYWSVGGTERARIDSSGNLLVGVNSLTPGNARGMIYSLTDRVLSLWHDSSNPGTWYESFFYNGTNTGRIERTGTTTVAYTTSSDYRLKENVQPMTGALAKVAQLKPCTYTWKTDGSAGQGFIAHELQEVVPDCVTGEKDGTRIEQYEISPAVPATYDEDGNELTPAVEAVMGEREVPVYQGIDTSFLVATLTAAIQELNAKVEAQAAEIASLKGATQ